jgi:hypothetical protein
MAALFGQKRDLGSSRHLGRVAIPQLVLVKELRTRKPRRRRHELGAGVQATT